MSRSRWRAILGWAVLAAGLAAGAEAKGPAKGTLVATVGAKTYHVSVLCDLFGDRYVQFRSDDTDINEPVDVNGDGVVITGSTALAKGSLSVLVVDTTGVPVAARAIPFTKSGNTVTASGKLDPPSTDQVRLTLTCE